MKVFGYFISFILLMGSSLSSANDLIGKTVPPYPKHWSEQGGSCIANCNYSIGRLVNRQKEYLYFGKNKQVPDAKTPFWKILDLMPYPEVPKGYVVVEGLCESNGIRDETIIAVVKEDENEWFSQTRFAYRANLETEQFETIATKGIRCLNNAWGL